MTASYWLGVVFAALILVTVFLRMRNSGMKEQYATWWFVIAGASAVFSVFPDLLSVLSHLVGVQVPLNLGFFAAGVVLLLLSLRFSVDLSRASEERRRLTEESAILRQEIEQLRKEVDGLKALGEGTQGESDN